MMLRKLSLAYCLLQGLSLSPIAQALEIAQAEIQSALGQSLRLKARLLGGPELAAPLATAVECQVAECRDIELRSRVSGRQSGDLAIEVTSHRPITQPAFVVRLSVRAGAESVTREFTVLLDPPAYQVRQVLLNSSPARDGAPPPPQRSPRPNRPETLPPATSSATRSERVLPRPDSSMQVTVQPGDTLSHIARRVARRHGGEAREWAEQLWRDNPQAFIQGDADRIKAGAVLNLAVAKAQSDAAAEASTPPPAEAPRTSGTAAGPAPSAAPEPAEQAPGADAETAAATSSARAEQLALQARLARMEERLLALEAALLARAASATPVETSLETPIETSLETSIETPVAPASAPPPASAEAREPTTPPEPIDHPASEVTASMAPDSPNPAPTTTVATAANEVATATASPPAAAEAAPAPSMNPVPATSPASTAVPDAWVSAWTLLAGGGLACAGLLLLGLRSRPVKPATRDRKPPGSPADEVIKDAIQKRLREDEPDPNTAAEAESSTVDLGKLNQALSNSVSEDAVITEVDVHIVYGAFAEAEAVLDEALAVRGGSPQLLVKLAEVYYYQRSAAKLTTLGERMKQLDLPAWAWAKVYRLGHDLCPEQAVFAEPSGASRAEAGGKVVGFPQRGAGRG